MCARPRKATDDEIFAAAARVMMRLGPNQITLADVAREAGLTAGALVQRFGSKRGLFLTLMQRFSTSTREMFDALRASVSTPLAAIYAYASCMAHMGETPDALAHHLSWLQQDLTDPEFRKFMLIHARATRRELERFVREAIGSGELAPSVDAEALARAIETMVGGSLMAWAVHQEGTAASWVRQDLEVVLRPWLTTPARHSRRKAMR